MIYNNDNINKNNSNFAKAKLNHVCSLLERLSEFFFLGTGNLNIGASKRRP